VSCFTVAVDAFILWGINWSLTVYMVLVAVADVHSLMNYFTITRSSSDCFFWRLLFHIESYFKKQMGECSVKWLVHLLGCRLSRSNADKKYLIHVQVCLKKIWPPGPWTPGCNIWIVIHLYFTKGSQPIWYGACMWEFRSSVPSLFGYLFPGFDLINSDNSGQNWQATLDLLCTCQIEYRE
jgi:hypothetical protein